MRARRSCLSVPGSSRKMLAKAQALPADEIVIDLEDAVAVDRKEDARSIVVEILRDTAWANRQVSVRINAIGSPWFEQDVVQLQAVAGEALSSLVVPKLRGPADLAAVEDLLADSDSRRQPALVALIETPQALLEVAAIASASTRMEALVVGYADLAASLGRPAETSYPGDRWHTVRETVLIAARANGLQAINGPFLQIGDLAGMRASALQVRALGYDGMWAVHPDQIAPLNEIFAPTRDELERARAILAALEDAARKQGRGAVMVDGEMLDEASGRLAAQLLARGKAAGMA